MVDRHARFATEHLAAANRIESSQGGNMITLSRFGRGEKTNESNLKVFPKSIDFTGGQGRYQTTDTRIFRPAHYYFK
jgi:hypothetical protein